MLLKLAPSVLGSWAVVLIPQMDVAGQGCSPSCHLGANFPWFIDFWLWLEHGAMFRIEFLCQVSYALSPSSTVLLMSESFVCLFHEDVAGSSLSSGTNSSSGFTYSTLYYG